MDSVTDEDIDRIFKRFEQKINLETINTEKELLDAVRIDTEEARLEGKKFNSQWNKKINDVMWEEIAAQRFATIDFFRETAMSEKTTQTLGRSLGQLIQMLFRKDGRTQLVARDSKGRFTSINNTILNGLLRI